MEDTRYGAQGLSKWTEETMHSVPLNLSSSVESKPQAFLTLPAWPHTGLGELGGRMSAVHSRELVWSMDLNQVWWETMASTCVALPGTVWSSQHGTGP